MKLLKMQIVSYETVKRELKYSFYSSDSRLLMVQPEASDHVIKGAESSICSFQPESIQ